MCVDVRCAWDACGWSSCVPCLCRWDLFDAHTRRSVRVFSDVKGRGGGERESRSVDLRPKRKIQLQKSIRTCAQISGNGGREQEGVDGFGGAREREVGGPIGLNDGDARERHAVYIELSDRAE